MEYQKCKKTLQKYSEVYLYGAGVVAYGAYKALHHLFDINVKGFLVTDKEAQPCEIEGIAVHALGEIQIDRAESLIIIATPEEYQANIEQALLALHFLHYIKLDSHMEYILMGSYLKQVENLALIEDCPSGEGLENYDDVRVYMAVSHKDKSLKGMYCEKPWVKKIQVGAALTKERIADLTDIEDIDLTEKKDLSQERSLSEKNALYGELTASYYAWKHGGYAITGLFHYRRVLSVTEEQLQLLKEKKLDVILPLPFVCYPEASGQYGRYLRTEDIEIMHQVLKEQEQERYKELEELLKRPYLYNYNMLIARKEVFEDYCGWLFPLLDKITDRCEKEKRDRLPRYIGRVGEVLTSLYFMRNSKGWKIVHGEKIWRI